MRCCHDSACGSRAGDGRTTRALALVLLVGCGRIGFGTNADGSPGGSADAAACMASGGVVPPRYAPGSGPLELVIEGTEPSGEQIGRTVYAAVRSRTSPPLLVDAARGVVDVTGVRIMRPSLVTDGERYDVVVFVDRDADGVCSSADDALEQSPFLVAGATPVILDLTPMGIIPAICVGMATPFLPPGDVDGDGCVDLSDVGILETQLGMTGPRLQGDLDRDGDVDGDDLTVLDGHYCTCPGIL